MCGASRQSGAYQGLPAAYQNAVHGSSLYAPSVPGLAAAVLHSQAMKQELASNPHGLEQELQKLRLTGRQQQSASSSPPVSPRSACSTPGRIADALRCSSRRGPPSRQFSCNDRHRFTQRSSQESKRPSPFCGNPWQHMGSQGTGSAYSSSSACSIVRAIAGLGLEGPRASGGAKGVAAPAAPGRGSISKAKKILAEVCSIPGAHGLASCALSAADTGVLSPLLTIIRNNGLVKSAPDAGARSSGCSSSRGVSRRSSFSDNLPCQQGLSRSSLEGARERRVLRRSSFSEAAGGLNSEDFGAATGSECSSSSVLGDGGGSSSSSSCSSSGTSRASSPHRQSQQVASPQPPPSPAAQQQKVVDCLETVRYLAMDDSNRMALIDLGAVELLLHKLQPTLPGGLLQHGKPASGFITSTSSSSSISSAPAVVEAVLSALSVLAKHDATKLRVWDNPGSVALLQLLALRQASPVVKAAHLCVANLAWSGDLDRSCQAASSGGSSSVFDSVSSHPGGRDDAASVASSSCGSNVLLAPALIPALAAALHPAADAPVLLSLLKLLNKGAASSCLASGSAGSPCSSSSCASESSNEQLCAVSFSHTHGGAWKVGWQQAIFALPPLLLRARAGPSGAQASCSPGRHQQQQVLGAALELLLTLTEQHPEFQSAICAAGCTAPLLALLLSCGVSSSSCGGGVGGGEHSLQAACVLNALLDCPDAVQQLGQEQSLALLLQVLGDARSSVDVRLAMVHVLRRLAAASHSCVELLKAQGAVQAVVGMLAQVHNGEVKRAAVGLLQLLGKQVVVRPRSSRSRQGSVCGGDSQRSSFGSAGSDLQCHQLLQPAGAVEAAMHSLEQLALEQQQEQHRGRQLGQHRLAGGQHQQQGQQQGYQQAAPHYLHAH